MTVLAFLLARHKTKDERKGWIYLGVMMALSAFKMVRPVVDASHSHDFQDTMVSLVAFAMAVMGLYSFHRLHLRRSKQLNDQFKWMVEELPQLSWITDTSGAVLYFNPRWNDYFEGSRDSALQHGWTSVIYEDDLPKVMSWVDNAIKSGLSLKVEFRAKTKSGVKWFQMRAHPIKDSKGSIVRWLGQAVDVDEYRKLFDVKAQ